MAATEAQIAAALLQHLQSTSVIRRCGVEYGNNINPTDCAVALNYLLPDDDWLIPYYINRGQNTPTDLPLTVEYNTCVIQVEYATPASNPPSQIYLAPNWVRTAAQEAITRCPAGPISSIGGFITQSMVVFVNWVARNRIYSELKYPPLIPLSPGTGSDPGFVTVTVKGRMTTMKSPGDTDYIIPFKLSQWMMGMLSQYDQGTAANSYLRALANRLVRGFLAMDQANGTQNWYDPTPVAPSEMTYRCDATLGNPNATDCELLLYQGLGRAEEEVSLGPGQTKYFTQGTCSLAVSASMALNVTWKQITAAFQSLFVICVEEPYFSSGGGRAFFAAPSDAAVLIATDFKYLGRRKRLRNLKVPGILNSWMGKLRHKRDYSITGLNALPAGANLTLWKNSGDPANLACEFTAAASGKPVSSCK